MTRRLCCSNSLPVLLMLLASCGRGARHSGAEQVLLRSPRLAVVLDSHGDLERIRVQILGERAELISETSFLVSEPPSAELASLGDEAPSLVLSFNGTDLRGGLVLALSGIAPSIAYQKFSPDDGVCSKFSVDRSGVRDLLVVERAAVFPVAQCLGPEDCVWQVPSRWATPMRFSHGAVVESEEPSFYGRRAIEYSAAADSVRNGALARGVQTLHRESVSQRCGSFVADSLESLAQRALGRQSISNARASRLLRPRRSRG